MAAVWEQRTIRALAENGSELVASLAPLPKGYVSFSITESGGHVQLSLAQTEQLGLLLVAMARQSQPEFK